MPRFVNRRFVSNQTFESIHRVRNASPELVACARANRKAPTPAEAILWDSLCNRKLQGLRFRRQHPVGTMILDFYCPAVMLVIELDGAWHDTPEQKARDDERTALLNLKGYHVLRFRNDEVLENLGAVLAAIQKAAQS